MVVGAEATTSLLVLLCIVIAGLCCMSFYLFRSVNSRHKEQQDMTSAVKSAVEVVLTLSEKGLPGMNNKLMEVESRIKSVEQNVKKQESKITEISEAETNAGEALVEVQKAIDGINTEKGPIQLSKTLLREKFGNGPYSGKGDTIMSHRLSEEEIIKAARASKQQNRKE